MRRRWASAAPATASLVFEDCIVPAENLLGEEGQGFKVAMHTLDGGRIGIAAQALGIAEGALNEAIAYVKMRESSSGKPLSAFQNTQFVIANPGPTRSRRPSCWSTAPAWAKDNHLPYSVEVCPRQAVRGRRPRACADRVRAAAGRLWYPRSTCGRMMRGADHPVYEGTSEVQRMVISRSLRGTSES